jgi:hypothetical protein
MVNRGFFRVALAGGLVAAAVTVTPPAAFAANGGPRSDATAAVVAWNAESLAVTLAEPLNPPLEGRNIAIETAAVYDAVISIIPRFRPHAIRVKVSRPASAAAAADAAAHAVMKALYPDQQVNLDAFEATQLAAIPDGPAKISGQVVGEESAAAMLALRAGVSWDA